MNIKSPKGLSNNRKIETQSRNALMKMSKGINLCHKVGASLSDTVWQLFLIVFPENVHKLKKNPKKRQTTPFFESVKKKKTTLQLLEKVSYFQWEKGTDLSQENKHLSYFTTISALFHRKALDFTSTKPWTKGDPIPNLQLQLLLGSSAMLGWGEAWVQVFVEVGLLYQGWLQSSRHESGRGARAKTKLSLKPQGFQTLLRHTSTSCE